MSNSLRDQLLKAGLVNEKQVKQASKDVRKKEKHNRHGNSAGKDENMRAAEKARAAKVEHDRQLNQERAKEAERKALAAQIKQLIEMNRVAPGDDEIAYRFAHDNKVKTVYVSRAVHQSLVAGRLAIASLESRYEIVPLSVAEKIMQRDTSRIVLLNQPDRAEDLDDEYAEYKVPDDLMW
ncbi:hypothetical protein sS8_2058 [Methylocaldum marinum]|uniref:Nucleoprotein/polynucleotide-associated enzyme n=1 Tax=Methylocaldum marinum TaxID=1432792 RepID=A0A250KST1_9GAMM|nr:DUF2058 domain-containing protein [Methylocaldum marinum]BBA34011.1 hypothetical protein sS8_2058 [Methylocaldum marinum]